ncbi:MAG: DUF2207 domain-containing protein [Bacilli bacterium]|jgi:uncharacterized membrane protein
MNGSFNGYGRDLYYKGNYALYDASSLVLQRVCELDTSQKGLFTNIEDNLICFTEDDYATLGDSYVYTKADYTSSLSLKMFDYTVSSTKIFYIEYLLTDVVVIHNDVAELYWTFIGENFVDDMAEVNITINLPSEASDLRVWAHGALNGNLAKEGNNKIVATVTDLYANNLVDIRATFDKNIVPFGSKISDDEALPSILEEEQIRADQANKERETAKLINNGVLLLNGLWIIGAVVLAIYIYRKYDKEHTSNFNLEYYRDLPAEYGPEVLEYLLKKRITTVSLSAVILNIISKKGFAVKEELSKKDKKEYTLVKKDDPKEALTEEETYIVDWLINDLGDGKEVSLKAIKGVSSTETSAKEFVKKYNKWLSLSNTKAEREKLFEDSVGIKVKGAIYAVLGFALTSLSLSIGSFMTSITAIIALILFVYVLTFKQRTIKGNDHFVKWQAFKKFLLDFGRFNEKELPEIALWEKYLVYATVFGIADKVYKAMEIKVKDMGTDMTMPMYSHIYLNYYFASTLTSTVNTARSMSISQIASSAASSGRGSGGGFSGGGGFGGGGTGGGGGGF